MANTIQIKRSLVTASPSDLLEGELAFSEASNTLFIGVSGGAIKQIGGAIGTKVQEHSAVLDNTTASFTTAQSSKLGGIEAGAEVTSSAKVAAAGAVMDGDFTSNGIMLRTASGAYSVVNNNATNWNTAYGWGNHSTQGYAKTSSLATVATSGNYNDLTNKPDLSALAEIHEYASQSSFPASGETGMIYIAADTGYTYRWNGSGYSQLTDQTAIWGEISGTLTNQPDLKTALEGKLNSSSYTAADVKTKYESLPNTNAFTDTYKSSIDTLIASSGTVTSVGLSVPTGLKVTNSPITTSGVIAVSMDTGYQIPTTVKQGNWDTAYGWGSHASAGYALGSRTITAGTGLTGGGNLTANRTLAVSYGTAAGTAAQGNDSRINNGQTAFGWGDHSSAGYLTSVAVTWDDVSSKPAQATRWPTFAEVTSKPATYAPTIGTTATTAAAGNDSRLTDSREWTASAVTQAEAEAGTSTTARKWTAQRVRQAIAAWWNSSSSVTGRAVVTAADASAARTAIGAGTSNLAIGTTASTAAAGNDSRIINGQTAFGWGNHASGGYLKTSSTIDGGTF